jgi:hypothetical protein
MAPSTTVPSERTLVVTTTHGLIEHVWPLVSVVVGFVLRMSSRIVARIFRAAAWSWLLKREGVSAARRRELVDGAAERDLKSS